MITTTLNRIWAHGPCAEGWAKLLKHLGKTQADDDPLPFTTILESNGLDDALWCCRAEPQYAKEWRLYGVWCARQVQHLLSDQRSIDALDVSERYANGQATDAELETARAAARAAAWAAGDAEEATAWTAAWAARAAAWAAGDAEEAAEEAAAGDAWAAAWAARAAWAAWAAARAAQSREFLRVITDSEERKRLEELKI